MTLFCWLLGLYMAYIGGAHVMTQKSRRFYQALNFTRLFIKLIGDRKRSFQSSFTVLTLLLHTTHEISCQKRMVSVAGKKKNITVLKGLVSDTEEEKSPPHIYKQNIYFVKLSKITDKSTFKTFLL